MNTTKGFSLVEVLLSVSILSFIVTALIGAVIYGRESTAIAGTISRAGLLAEEGLEVARNIRDGSFTNLSAGTHGITVSGNQWTFSGSSDVTAGFTRQVAVAPVDSSRNTVTSTVTWAQNAQRTGSASFVTRLTNWRRNNGAAVPTVPETSLNIPGSASGTEIALYATGSATYAVETRVSSSDKELYVVDVTNSSVPVIAGSLEIGSTVNDIVVIGSNAYLATSSNTQQVQVVSLNTPSTPTLIGSLALPGNAAAQTITGMNANLYVGRISSTQREIVAVSIATPSSPAILSSLEMGGTVNKLVLAPGGTTLYAATGNNASEFVTVDVSNPSSITQAGSLNLAGSSAGTAVEAFAQYAAVGRANGDLYIIDASAPTAPVIVGGPLSLGTQIMDLVVGPGQSYLFSADSTVGGEVTVVDIGSVAAPSIFFSVNLSGNAGNGIIWDPGPNKIYVAASSNTAEFVVIKSP